MCGTNAFIFLSTFSDEPKPSLEPKPEPEAPPTLPEAPPTRSPPSESDQSETLSQSSTTVSDTNNEHVSDGQWLLSVYSEGELPRPQIEDGMYFPSVFYGGAQLFWIDVKG